MRVLTRSVGYKQLSMRHADTSGNPSSPGASLVVQSSSSLFFLRLCTEFCSIQPGQRNLWRSFSFIYCWQLHQHIKQQTIDPFHLY
ncbi:unnamed protein product [Hymenolepis diminuta]|uniref:Uncharacterized protein n=1 Tax=Hymenolepis diminuta TaxID=6216 RepID=A0A564YDK6_HYMDI|nr:unnamed protein product [Hymenolepis diminuta]